MGDYNQKITAIEEQVRLGETTSPDDILWLCQNLRSFLATCKQLNHDLYRARYIAIAMWEEAPDVCLIKDDLKWLETGQEKNA